jgi:hypothetical protein
MRLTGFNIGVIVSSTIYGLESISTPMTIPSQSGLTAIARVADDNGATLSIKHSVGASSFATASLIGTISWGSAQLAGSVRLDSSVTLAVGGYIIIEASDITASGTNLTDFTWSIRARSGS